MKRRIAVAVAALALSACAAPTHQYINADALGMYFALPASWTEVSNKQLATAQQGWNDDAGNVFLQTKRWQGAWSATPVDANAVFTATPGNVPIVYAFVRDLISQEQQGIGTNVSAALRDLVLPATAIVDAGVPVEAERLKQAGFTGLRQTATYVSGGAMQTTEVVSMLNPQRSRVFVLVARCSVRCFTNHADEVRDIIDSLTFKESRGN